MEIRDAVAEDAPASREVIRRSIVQLCTHDHRNDPAIRSRWLDNKTPEIVATWITGTDASMLVAVENKTILAAGSVTGAGHITLSYVSPDARFRGVSLALPGALEGCAPGRGDTRCPPISTERRGRSTRPWLPDRRPAGASIRGRVIPDVEAAARPLAAGLRCEDTAFCHSSCCVPAAPERIVAFMLQMRMNGCGLI